MNIYTKNKEGEYLQVQRPPYPVLAVADDMLLDDIPEAPELPQRRYQQLHLGEGRKP